MLKASELLERAHYERSEESLYHRNIDCRIHKTQPYYFPTNGKSCLCAHGVLLEPFLDVESDIPKGLLLEQRLRRAEMIGRYYNMPTMVAMEIEARYEGQIGNKYHTFLELAEWLKNLGY